MYGRDYIAIMSSCIHWYQPSWSLSLISETCVMQLLHLLSVYMQAMVRGRVWEGDVPPPTVKHRSYIYDTFQLNPMYMSKYFEFGDILFQSTFQTQGGCMTHPLGSAPFDVFSQMQKVLYNYCKLGACIHHTIKA